MILSRGVGLGSEALLGDSGMARILIVADRGSSSVTQAALAGLLGSVLGVPGCLSGFGFSVGSLNRHAKSLLECVGVDALVVAPC